MSIEIEEKYRQWLADGKSYAVPNRDSETYEEHLQNVDISREMELLKETGLESEDYENQRLQF